MPRPVPFPKTTIGPQFTKRVMPWIETFWHNKKRYPTDGELAAQFGWTAQEIEFIHFSKFYNDSLERRGITREENYLTEKQVAAISLISNFSDTRTSAVKMASIGVSTEEINGWYANPTFQRELAARADAILDNVFPEAQAQLARQIKNGHFPALKFYYEITGRAASPEQLNLRAAMVRIIEAVQKHVKDPAVIQAIANEVQGLTAIESVSNNGAVAALPAEPELTMADKYKEFISNGNPNDAS